MGITVFKNIEKINLWCDRNIYVQKQAYIVWTNFKLLLISLYLPNFKKKKKF